MPTSYSGAFYDEMKDTNLISARKISGLVMDMLSPRSVIDIGCGTGLWLKAFSERGASDIFGVDGSWVKDDMLVIPKDRFKAVDIEKPFTVGRTADLAVCLEVAEHVPASSAESLVAAIVASAPVALFSAAIPLQGGSHHVNEQWPVYWQAIFAKHGYVPVDALRRRVWDDKDVSFFYAQNVLLYVDKAKLRSYPSLQAEIASGHGAAPAFVHPFLYTYYAERWRMLVPFLGKLPVGLLKRVKRALSRRA
ncbi:MAG: methyltransferase domain-containing protein [Patescibacteria group bacterium]|nr:methyltransferase domain-containing protein [Patescibacteria group bacterium]MDE2116374.1 methyltransferase domain-containing protein [Patescibacteria group bacterium]